MSNTGAMQVSSTQAHRLDALEAQGHALEQLGQESFACSRCEWDGPVTDGRTSALLSNPCPGGTWLGEDGDSALTA